MKTAAAYIRVSTDDQLEYSPDSQLDLIKKYAFSNGYTLPEEYIYIEEGISGKSTKNRREFTKMIAVAKTKPKPFEAILLWKFSRFARNREDSIVYKSMLRKQLGIDVISVSENLGDDKISILIEAMIEAMDEYYSINLAEEVKRGMTEKARRGEYCCAPAFGYRLQNKELIPHPEEAAIIRKVFEDYSHGIGMLHIAKNLNALGIRTHRGNKIENRTIEYWLNNPIYTGKTRWTPTGSINRNYNHPDSIIAQGHHKAIISPELWEQVQNRIRKQKEYYKKWYTPQKNISHWLVGLVRCSICGGPVVNCSGYMYCNNKNKGTCTGNGGISIKLMENAILSRLEQISASHIEITFKSATPHGNSNEIIENALKKAQKKLIRIKESYENGIDTINEYKENKAKIQNEINTLTAKLHEKNTFSSDKKTHSAITELLPALRNEKIPASEKNTIARAFIDAIIKGGTDGRSLTIIFRTFK